MSQEGLLYPCMDRKTLEYGLSFIGCEGRVLKKNIPHQPQNSYPEYAVISLEGRRRDRTTPTEPPAWPFLTRGDHSPRPEETLILSTASSIFPVPGDLLLQGNQNRPFMDSTAQFQSNAKDPSELS